MSIAFIGLGAMGHHMAANLLRAGPAGPRLEPQPGARAGAGRARRQAGRDGRPNAASPTSSSPCWPTTTPRAP